MFNNNKKIKFLEALCRTQEHDIENIESQIRKLRSNMLTIDDAKTRDYIVRTTYIGKITDQKLLKDFENKIADTLGDTFKNICNNILNFQLINLHKYYDILKDYEMKQIVIDTYRK